MSALSHHTVWSGYLSAGDVDVGDVVCLNAEGTGFVVSTAANRTGAGRGSAGIAITPADSSVDPAFELQFVGLLPNSVTGLGAGDAVPVRVSTTGRLERIANPTTDDEIVGRCDTDGTLYANLANQGELTSAAIVAGSPKLGWFNVLDYGAVADGVTDNTAAFTAAIVASGVVSPYQGGSTGAPFAGVVYVPPGAQNYYFASDLDITRGIELYGLGQTNEARSPTVLQFAAGKGIVIHSAGTSPESSGNGTGAFIHGLTILCSPLTLPLRANNTAYALNDLMRLPNDNRYYYKCTTAGTSDASSPFGAATLAGGADFASTAGRREFTPATTDGTAAWTCYVAAGVKMWSRAVLRDLYISDATNAAIHVYGDVATHVTDCNGSVIENIFVNACGVGVHVHGGDANACHIFNVQMYATGSHYSGTGGFGAVDTSFFGCNWSTIHSEGGTGRAVWNASGYPMASFMHLYTEGDTPPIYSNGFVLGGNYGFEPTSPHTGHNWTQLWKSIFSIHGNVDKLPQMRFTDSSDGTFLNRYSSDDAGFNPIGERYYSAGYAPDGKVVGCWVTGAKSIYAGTSADRRIFGLTTAGTPSAGLWGQSPEGTGNLRLFRGEFRGDGAAPYYLGFEPSSTVGSEDIGSKADRFVRWEQGLAGRRAVGDRFETGAEDSIGDYVYQQGWEAYKHWVVGINATCYDSHSGGIATVSVRPSTPNGYIYACTVNGVGDASSEPDWDSATGFLGSGGICTYRWHASMLRKVGDYGAPSVSHTRNGHYYKVTAVSSPDADGYGAAGSSEPTWPTGGGSTVTDGALTWTEQGSDVGSYITDGTTEWCCIGPAPLYRNYGFRTWVPYQIEFDDVVVGAFDADGVTFYKVVTVNSAQTTIGDLTTDLQIHGNVIDIKTGGELDITNTHTVFAGGFGSRPDVLTKRIAPVATTDATITDLFTWTLAEGTNTFSAEIQVRKSDYSHSASFGRKCTFRLNGSSGVFQGTVIDTGSEEADLASLTITVDHSGTTGRLRFTGIAATNLVINATINLVSGD